MYGIVLGWASPLLALLAVLAMAVFATIGPQMYWSEARKEFLRLPAGFNVSYAKEHVWEGSLVDSTDITEIEAIVILKEVLGLARPQYKLRGMVRSIPMDKLVARIPIATGLTGQEKVGELEEAEINKQAYTYQAFELYKNVVHIAMSDEAQMKANLGIMAMHISDAARDLARMENKQIAETLDLCDNNVAAAGGSAAIHTWDTSTDGVSDANPWIDILAGLIAIDSDGFPPDLGVMHPQVWQGLITNDWVKRQVEVGLGRVTATGLALPGFPDIGVLLDYAVLPITSCYLMSTKAPAIVMGVGPTLAARYRHEVKDYDAYKIRQFLDPEIIDFGTGIDALYEITGAHS